MLQRKYNPNNSLKIHDKVIYLDKILCKLRKTCLW